jgi:hypothetical protein
VLCGSRTSIRAGGRTSMRFFVGERGVGAALGHRERALTVAPTSTRTRAESDRQRSSCRGKGGPDRGQWDVFDGRVRGVDDAGAGVPTRDSRVRVDGATAGCCTRTATLERNHRNWRSPSLLWPSAMAPNRASCDRRGSKDEVTDERDAATGSSVKWRRRTLAQALRW